MYYFSKVFGIVNVYYKLIISIIKGGNDFFKNNLYELDFRFECFLEFWEVLKELVWVNIWYWVVNFFFFKI